MTYEMWCVSDRSKDTPSFSQLMRGVGSPLALHSRLSSSPMGALTSDAWSEFRMVGGTGRRKYSNPFPYTYRTRVNTVPCRRRKVCTLHHECVVFLCLSLAVLGYTRVCPCMGQAQRPQLQSVTSDRPLPLQTALWARTSAYFSCHAWHVQFPPPLPLYLPMGVPSLSQVMLGTGTPVASHTRATWEPRV